MGKSPEIHNGRNVLLDSEPLEVDQENVVSIEDKAREMAELLDLTLVVWIRTMYKKYHITYTLILDILESVDFDTIAAEEVMCKYIQGDKQSLAESLKQSKDEEEKKDS
ncbi:uncharacterized protein CMU_016240 [Cryptosporidium muris RN66]|uniref:Uncharacterized protein n=1 Tax=Cryptosporidium muris (strain RN66) TaxID=441375 RepID=B6ACM1_CRYMR|nr:uncharacterized protein CMU_016240 [Cryptosporidium muris RN66]EEA05875.1 hypothetical protein CMU_016240 [Cryptosporidium muris RN66]|eukprot:XP_002140224.1 hypothetical protein [Cryptosporidium muris RN66]